MISTEHSQSVSEFGQNAQETFDRLEKTGEPEFLTVGGAAKAVLLSPAAYEELIEEVLAERDAESIRRSLEQIRNGDVQEANAFFAELRAKLLAMKAAAANGEPA